MSIIFNCSLNYIAEDGRIIVYGGYGGYTGELDPVPDDLVVLDTTDNFTWSNASHTNPPPSRFYHTATLVGDYMIVAFGRTNKSPEPNEIFILYTGNKSDYKWVDEFIPPVPPSNPTPSTYSTPSIIRNLIIGIVILSTVLALIGGLFLIYLYRRRRRLQPDVFISGNTVNSPESPP